MYVVERLPGFLSSGYGRVLVCVWFPYTWQSFLNAECNKTHISKKGAYGNVDFIRILKSKDKPWKDALRYPLLVVHAPSYCGKTEWAHSLFKRPLELKVGTLQHFPEAMRRFDREKFDGLVLDDVRDLTFLGDHQEKLQGMLGHAVCFVTTSLS